MYVPYYKYGKFWENQKGFVFCISLFSLCVLVCQLKQDILVAHY